MENQFIQANRWCILKHSPGTGTVPHTVESDKGRPQKQFQDQPSYPNQMKREVPPRAGGLHNSQRN